MGSFKMLHPSRSVGVKLFLAIFAVMLLLISTIGYFSYRTSSDVIRQKVSESSLKAITQSVNKIDLQLSVIDRIAMKMTTDDKLLADLAVFETLSPGTMEWFRWQNKLSVIMRTYSTLDYGISSIFILSEREENALSSLGNFNLTMDFRREAWFSEFEPGDLSAHWLATKRGGYLDSSPSEVFALARLMSNRETQQSYILLFVLNISLFSNTLNKLVRDSSGEITVLNDRNDILYSNERDKIATVSGMKLPNRTDEREYTGSFIGDGPSGASALHHYYESPITHWIYLQSTPLSELLKESRRIYALTLYMIAAASLLSLLLAALISRHISTPIRRLERSMKKVEEGNLDTRVEVSSSDEIGRLSRAFNRMAYQIQELMNQNSAVHEMKRRSELQALQAQINPHFLYNTLDSIVWMAEGGKNREVVYMTTALAKLFRISLSNGKDLVPLSDEAEHIRSYLEIQKMRYGDQLDYSIEIDSELSGCKVLKVLLQPIVENAIYHGIKNKTGIGMIRIFGHRYEDLLLLQISDNGLGMAPETLLTLFEAKRTVSKTGGIGIRNVDERIKLYFGQAYGLKIESEPNIGTTVYVTLPIIETERGGPTCNEWQA